MPKTPSMLGPSAPRKVAGGRRKPLSPTTKENIPLSSDSEDLIPKPATHRRRAGRPSGAGNFLDSDVKVILDLVEKTLPLGLRGWRQIHQKYTKWAKKNGRPERAMKSLETKFKQVSGHSM